MQKRWKNDNNPRHIYVSDEKDFMHNDLSAWSNSLLFNLLQLPTGNLLFSKWTKA